MLGFCLCGLVDYYFWFRKVKLRIQNWIKNHLKLEEIKINRENQSSSLRKIIVALKPKNQLWFYNGFQVRGLF